jgi:uncharacterized membrane protein
LPPLPFGPTVRATVDSSPTDETAPRFEAQVDTQPATPQRTITSQRVAFVLVALALSARFPYSVGAALVLPGLFAWLGLRAVARRATQQPYTVRFFEDALEVRGDDYVARTGWEHIRGAKESEVGVVIAMPAGRQVVIPRAQLPEDRRLLIDAMPAHVRFEVIPSPVRTKTDSYKTLALWAALMVLLAAIWWLMEHP